MASRMASSSSSMIGASRTKAFSAAVRRAPVARAARSVQVKAMVRQYPDPEFMDWCAKNFPENAVAEPDEVRCLLAQGWYWLDVRPALEYEEAGRCKESVNIPIKKLTKKFVDGKKAYEKHDIPTEEFLKMVSYFFHKDDKIMVGCSDGQAYSIDALIALDEAGYTNLVGIAGGYYEWFRYFDNKMVRRTLGEYQEKYDGEGADSCGIHASGAGFERVDAIEKWAPPSF